MARAVILYSGSWADTPVEVLAQKAGEWGYQGLELCCWGEHFAVQRALTEDGYCQQVLELLAQYDLTIPVLSNHRVGQAVGDTVDERHRAILPDYVWGDGVPGDISQRAAAEMMATAKAAQKLGVPVVSGFTGSPLWAAVMGFPPVTPAMVSAGMQEFVKRWEPILDVFRECEVRFAFEVHPGQVAFDLYSTEAVLAEFAEREEFGFLFDPSHLHWQGIDPVEFLRRFGERIYHVHFKDIALTLNGRAGLLCSYFPPGDPRRGWQFRSPGRGGLDWESIIRGLNEIGYDGPLAVEWKDSGMERNAGAEEACQFVKRLDFPPSRTIHASPFRESAS